jgi:hypothetical protein
LAVLSDDLAPVTTPGCIVKVKQVSLAFGCRAEPTHAGLVLISDQVFLAFACLEHKSRLIAPRRTLDRDRAELERRRHSWGRQRRAHQRVSCSPLGSSTPVAPSRGGGSCHQPQTSGISADQGAVGSSTCSARLR